MVSNADEKRAKQRGPGWRESYGERKEEMGGEVIYEAEVRLRLKRRCGVPGDAAERMQTLSDCPPVQMKAFQKVPVAAAGGVRSH